MSGIYFDDCNDDDITLWRQILLSYFEWKSKFENEPKEEDEV